MQANSSGETVTSTAMRQQQHIKSNLATATPIGMPSASTSGVG